MFIDFINNKGVPISPQKKKTIVSKQKKTPVSRRKEQEKKQQIMRDASNHKFKMRQTNQDESGKKE